MTENLDSKPPTSGSQRFWPTQAVMVRVASEHWGEVGFTYHVSDPARARRTLCGLDTEGHFCRVTTDPYRSELVTCKRCLRSVTQRPDVSPPDE